MKLIFKCASTITTTLAMLFGPHALADTVPLAQYLSSVDRSEITFSGRIRYNSSDRDFTFYNEDREPFGVTMDTGRDIREKVETECAGSGFMFSFSELCTISGSGTVEIRGSRIFISVVSVDHLGR
jgi:hypothetical protein